MKMMNPNWMTIQTDDLAHVAAGYASCIEVMQRLLLADGSTMSANDIADAVRRGHRIDFRTSTVSRKGACDNPVTGVVRTRGHGVRIVFDDGRAVSLTSGHVLPLDAEERIILDDDRYGDWDLPVHQQWIVRAGDVQPGMNLLDGHVAAVEALGKVDAVRLWTAHPAWIPTASGLRIGTRWHEILHAWAEIEEEYPLNSEGNPDMEAYPEIVPVAATGWLWGTGHHDQVYGWHQHGAYDKGRFKPVPRTDHGVYLGNLGSARNVRATVAQRWDLASQAPHMYLPGDFRRLGFRGQLPESRPAPHVKLLNPRTMIDALISGVEVVGEPMVLELQAA